MSWQSQDTLATVVVQRLVETGFKTGQDVGAPAHQGIMGWNAVLNNPTLWGLAVDRSSLCLPL
jgi:hypothetical protein